MTDPGENSVAELVARRVVVTGGSGFLGSHLCERLLADGCDVLCVDNFFTGQRANVHHLLSDPGFELMRHDVSLPLHVEADEIFNLACPASPLHYQRHPVQTARTSVLGAINMLELAERTQARIFQASTSEVYGDPKVQPQREDYWGNVNPIGARACYNESKRCAETLFFDYHRQMQIDVKVGRIFNTYGPRMHPDDGRVVSSFIVRALTHKPLTIHGDGCQTRSFCYVDDMVEAIVRFMSSAGDLIGPVNLGSAHEVTVLELAELVIDLCASRSKLVYEPGREDDPVCRRPDISLARKALAWEPAISLRDGLARTVEYFDALLAQTQPDTERSTPLGEKIVRLPFETRRG